MRRVQLKVSRDGTFEMIILEDDKERWSFSGISSVIVEDTDGVVILSSDGWNVFIDAYDKQIEEFILN